jgi:hypothetical protein
VAGGPVRLGSILGDAQQDAVHGAEAIPLHEGKRGPNKVIVRWEPHELRGLKQFRPQMDEGPLEEDRREPAAPPSPNQGSQNFRHTQHQARQPVACHLAEEMVDPVRPRFQSIAFEQDTIVQQEKVHPSSTPRTFLFPAWGRNGRRGPVLLALRPQLFLLCLEDAQVCQARRLTLDAHGLEELIQSGIHVNRRGSITLY